MSKSCLVQILAPPELNLSERKDEDRNGPFSPLPSLSLSLSLSRWVLGWKREEDDDGRRPGKPVCVHLLARVCTKACAEFAATRRIRSTRDQQAYLPCLCNSECIADVKPPAHVSHTPSDRPHRTACICVSAPRVDNSRANNSRFAWPLAEICAHAGSKN